MTSVFWDAEHDLFMSGSVMPFHNLSPAEVTSGIEDMVYFSSGTKGKLNHFDNLSLFSEFHYT